MKQTYVWYCEYVNPYIPIQAPRKNKRRSGIIRPTAAAHFMSDFKSSDSKHRKEHGHIHNTECPFWDKVLLNNKKLPSSSSSSSSSSSLSLFLSLPHSPVLFCNQRALIYKPFRPNIFSAGNSTDDMIPLQSNLTYGTQCLHVAWPRNPDQPLVEQCIKTSIYHDLTVNSITRTSYMLEKALQALQVNVSAFVNWTISSGFLLIHPNKVQ